MSRRYIGTWISDKYPLAYRVLPKCGCSTVGQWFHWLDHGAFYPGLIHDPGTPILKWGYEHARPIIAERLGAGNHLIFTLVRNPYRRLVSAFVDKIFGYQRDGSRYRGGQLHTLLDAYGLDFGPSSSIIDNFRAFVHFATDTTNRDEPIPADPHWRPCADHLRVSFAINRRWQPHYIGHVERLRDHLIVVAARAGMPLDLVPASLPRENTTSLGQVPFDSLYGKEEIDLVIATYERDFRWFGYSTDPMTGAPIGQIDMETVIKEGREVNQKQVVNDTDVITDAATS